jgi:putative peptidoglycan lipid II flippase
MTLVSRVLGLLRDIVFARFGIGAGMDAFFVAFKIPNFLRRLFAEGAFSQAFVPVLSEYKEQRTETDVRELVSRVAGTLAGILALVTVICVLASPVLVTIFAPGFLQDSDKFNLAADMLRWTFPYLLFISLVAFAAGILNTYGRFAAASFAPVWLNVVLIVAALFIAPQLEQPVLALAGGVFVAGIVQLLFLLPALKKIRLLPRPRWGLRDAGVRRIMKLMLPGIIGSSVAQINLLFDTLIASFLVTGSVSWLYYSDRLMEFPLGVFAIALSTVILPSLSRSHANQAGEEFSRTVDWGLRWVLLISLPAALGLVLLAEGMITTLFLHGDFSVLDVSMAGQSLMMYALGLPAFMMIKVLAPAFYSRKDTKTPVRIAVIAMVTNMVLNVLFVVPMVMMDIPAPHAGLALATSIAAYVNAGLLYRGLRKVRVYQPVKGWAVLTAQITAASFAMALLLLWGVEAPSAWAEWSGWGRAYNLALWIAAGTGIYLLVLRLVGVRMNRIWLHKGQ